MKELEVKIAGPVEYTKKLQEQIEGLQQLVKRYDCSILWHLSSLQLGGSLREQAIEPSVSEWWYSSGLHFAIFLTLSFTMFNCPSLLEIIQMCHELSPALIRTLRFISKNNVLDPTILHSSHYFFLCCFACSNHATFLESALWKGTTKDSFDLADRGFQALGGRIDLRNGLVSRYSRQWLGHPVVHSGGQYLQTS